MVPLMVCAKPQGWSQQRNTSTNKIENTYHYTNTYYKHAISDTERGGSGRVWGYGTVTATGTQCIPDVISYSVLTVKYGVST